MKPGKTVWIFEERKPVPVKLVTFGKGDTATIEFMQGPKAGRRLDVGKSMLHAKRPASSMGTGRT